MIKLRTPYYTDAYRDEYYYLDKVHCAQPGLYAVMLVTDRYPVPDVEIVAVDSLIECRKFIRVLHLER